MILIDIPEKEDNNPDPAKAFLTGYETNIVSSALRELQNAVAQRPAIIGPDPANPPTKIAVITIGHSIPNGKGLGGSRGAAYPALAVSYTSKVYDVYNFAEDGQSIFGLQHQIDQAMAVIDFSKYAKIIVILHCDVNDIRAGVSPQLVFAKQVEILGLFKDNLCDTILVGCFAYNDTLDSVGGNPYYVDNLRQKLLNLQRSSTLVAKNAKAYIDPYTTKLLPIGDYVGISNIDPDWYEGLLDGVHWGGYGHLEVALEVARAINDILLGNTYGAAPSIPNDVTLSALTFGALSEHPPFDGSQSDIIFTHKISAPAGTTQIPITATVNDNAATLAIDGVNQASATLKYVTVKNGITQTILSVKYGVNKLWWRILTTVGVRNTVPVIFTTLGLVQVGVDGWQKSGTVGYDVTSLKRAAGIDVIAQFTCSYENGMALGLDSSSAPNPNKDLAGNYQWDLQLYIDSNLQMIAAESNVATNLGAVPTVAFLLQINLKANDSAILSLSTDAGVTFTQIHAFAGTFAGIKYLKGHVDVYPFQLFQCRQDGLS